MKSPTYITLIFTIFCLFYIGNNAYAQDTTKSHSRNVKIDSCKTVVTEISEEKLNKYKEDKNFNYKLKKPDNTSMWELFMHYLKKILRTIFSNNGVTPYIRYAVAALILAVAGFLLYKSNLRTLFVANGSINNNQIEYCEANINEENLDNKLKKAIEKHNFRLAIRFYYILLLKNLNNQELIKWEINKTNKDYQNELRDKNIYSQFCSLSKLYEYSWYGNFEISETDFNSYKANFDDLCELKV